MEYLCGARACIMCLFITIKTIKMKEPTESNGVSNGNHNSNNR